QLVRGESLAPPTDQPSISFPLATSVKTTTQGFKVSVACIEAYLHCFCRLKCLEISRLAFTLRDCSKHHSCIFQDSTDRVYALRNSPFRVATLCLGLLCVILLAGVIGQSVHYQKAEQDRESNLKALSEEKEKLQVDLKTVQKDKRDLQAKSNQLQQQNDLLTKRKEQIQINNNLLTEQTNQLKNSQSELKTSNDALKKAKEELEASKDQLKLSNNALSTAKDLLQKNYDLVIQRKSELQTRYDSVTRDRDNLQNKYNNVTRSKEQLQKDYNALIKDVEHLQDRYNFSSREKDKLESSHQNLTITKETLQANFNVLVKATDELRASYSSLIQEKKELEKSCKNVTVERDWLKTNNDNLTTERDQLQMEVERLNATIQDKKCPSGWKKFEYSCYFTSSSKRTWNRSREYCQTKEADLAIITSQEEMTFINALYGSEKEVWIGLSDEGVEGQWKWVDGTPMTKAFWGKDQPNSHMGRNQDCVEFWHRASGTGDWNDENCAIEQNWICEK
uniref:C-type lectin domain-containing protein n=1 Tax=Dicentrarchus labrax TaxID=13489 RepID=A0A8C4NQ24_DICLA